jgi:prevent-host-death family protein
MDNVHGNLILMKSVSISQFKQTCLRLLEEVRQTGTPLLITKRGEPIAEVIPVQRTEREDWRGCLRESVDIVGDIVTPATEPDEWEALRE